MITLNKLLSFISSRQNLVETGEKYPFLIVNSCSNPFPLHKILSSKILLRHLI
jgi:hypothetical protein